MSETQAQTEISLVPSGAGALAVPLVILNDITIEMATNFSKEGQVIKIYDVEGFKKGAELLNQLGKIRNFIDKRTLSTSKPFRDEADRQRAFGKTYITMVEAAEKVVSAELLSYDRLQKAEAARAEQERQRLAAEQRRLEQERMQAEQEKKRLEQEAKLRQEQAALAVESAKDDAGFQAAAVAFDKGVEKIEEAAAVEVPVVPIEVILAPKEIVVPQVFKATGATKKGTPVIESYDLAQLALTYHMLNETKVKAHIKDGTITTATPGIVFRIDEGFRGSGR